MVLSPVLLVPVGDWRRLRCCLSLLLLILLRFGQKVPTSGASYDPSVVLSFLKKDVYLFRAQLRLIAYIYCSA